jgi:hypothetical protein
MSEFKIKDLSEISMGVLMDTLDWYNQLHTEGGGFPLSVITAIREELARRDPEIYGLDLRQATISSNKRYNWNSEGF